MVRIRQPRAVVGVLKVRYVSIVEYSASTTVPTCHTFIRTTVVDAKGNLVVIFNESNERRNSDFLRYLILLHVASMVY